MRTVSYTALRNKLASVLDSVVEDHAPVIITRQNAAPAVLMSMEDFSSWQETEYLLRSPTNAAHLAKAMRDLAEGKGVKFNPLSPAARIPKSSGRRRRSRTISNGEKRTPRSRTRSTP